MTGAALSTSPQVPGNIGEYRLLLPIATGGMGTVFLGEREVVPGVLRKFAIKLLHPRMGADDALSAELMKEAQLAARVRDPHVVTVHEAGADGGWLYLVMDYVDGDTLHALMRAARQRGERLPLPIVGRILVDALTGLHAAHEARDEQGKLLGIVHRDFSPQNILVGADGVARLTDFGIAKAMSQLGATATGVVKGKVSYMAPEQARGGILDRRCDVWAAGAVAWEALAGERLFKADSDAECLLKIVAGDALPLVSSVRPDASAEIAAVLSQALVRDRSLRVADAAELRAAVVAAWETLAEPREVAALLERLLGERLAKRREQAMQISSLKRAVTSPGITPLRDARESVEPKARGRVALFAFTVLLVTTALGTGWLLGRRAPSATPEALPSPSEAPPASSSAEPPARLPEEVLVPVASSVRPAAPRIAPVRKTPSAEPSTRAPDRLLGRD